MAGGRCRGCCDDGGRTFSAGRGLLQDGRRAQGLRGAADWCRVVAPAPAVVAAPAAAAVVATPGVGAPGVGVRAGTPMNRGGPVNRVGVR
jgi:hypothetical protein